MIIFSSLFFSLLYFIGSLKILIGNNKCKRAIEMERVYITMKSRKKRRELTRTPNGHRPVRVIFRHRLLRTSYCFSIEKSRSETDDGARAYSARFFTSLPIFNVSRTFLRQGKNGWFYIDMLECLRRFGSNVLNWPV